MTKSYTPILDKLYNSKHQVAYRKTERLVFEEYSATIRQLPQNYLIAHWKGPGWVCEPDLAANKDFAVKVFVAIMQHKNKYDKTAGFISDIN